MNTMIYSKSGSSAGIGFAVPHTTIQRVVPQIIATGHPERVGIGIRAVEDHVARNNRVSGVIINKVLPNSPAARAGLQGLRYTNNEVFLGDVISGVNEHPVRNFDDLYNALDQYRPGDTVNLAVVRDGRSISVPVELIDLIAGR